jgi:type 1 fimbria pilin
MTQWNPIWKVEIDGVEYTDAVLANLTIRSGRVNIYEQAQAGYVNLQLIDIAQTAIPVSINSTIGVQIKDTSNNFIPIFGGNVVDIGLEVRDVGSTTFTQTYNITALGALARLPKALTNGVLSKDFDGDQIYDILFPLLFGDWQSVPGSLTWATYNPTTTWANAENTGLGEIDRPGNYELAARSSSRTDVYSLVSALATSGLGYIYEDAQGRIGYADSTHRSTYLATNGYVDLDANHARAAGLRIETRVGDVRNSLTIKYGATSSSEQSASDSASISLYGELAQIITTTLHNAADATAQANFYLTLRANPQPIFSEITFDLTNPELDNADRDNLLNIFMGEAIALVNLPSNMSSGRFQGFVEGWSFQASYNQLSVTLLLSPLAYSLQAMAWDDVPITETWSSVSPTLDWQNATIVA